MAISSPEMMLVPGRSVSRGQPSEGGAGRRTQVDVAEATAAYLPADTILVPHAEVLSTGQRLPSMRARRVLLASGTCGAVGWVSEAVRTIVVISECDLKAEDLSAGCVVLLCYARGRR